MTEATRLALADKIEYAVKTEGNVILFDESAEMVVAALRAIPQEPWRPIATAPKYETILGWWRNGEQHTGSTDGARWFPAWDNQDRNWSMPTLWRSLSDPNESSAPVALSSLPSGESDPSVMPDSAGAGPSSDGGVEGHAVSSALSGRTSSGHMAAVQGVCSLEETPLRTEAGIKPGPSEPIAQGQREAFKPITMQDVRLAVGEGRLSERAILDACNIVIRQRLATLPQPPVGVCREALERISRYPFENPESDDAIIIKELALTALAPSAQEGWQLIETAPRDGTHILVVDEGVVSEAYFNLQDDAFWLAQTDPHDFDPSHSIYPTHWMPKPAPPSISRPHGGGDHGS